MIALTLVQPPWNSELGAAACGLGYSQRPGLISATQLAPRRACHCRFLSKFCRQRHIAIGDFPNESQVGAEQHDVEMLDRTNGFQRLTILEPDDLRCNSG